MIWINSIPYFTDDVINLSAAIFFLKHSVYIKKVMSKGYVYN